METIHVARYECKYHVNEAQRVDISRYLERYCVPDSYSSSGDWYAIHSLYLDTDGYRLYRDAREKRPYRLKLRVRSYGSGTGPVKLEVKRRLLETIVKTSATLNRDLFMRATESGLSDLLSLGKASVNQFLQLIEGLHARPKLLVGYERQAFTSTVDDYVRVTFDRRMICQNMEQWDLAGSPRHWLPVDIAKSGARSPYVMEVKFMDAPAAWLRDMVLRFGLVRGGYSKYCRAVDRSARHCEPAWDLRPRDAA